MQDPSENLQVAPYPHELAALVAKVRHRPGWTISLYDDYVRDPASTHKGESRGLTLCVTVATTNSYPPHEPISVNHFFAVPPATYTTGSWQRWLFEQLLLVERHEAAEFFTYLDETVCRHCGQADDETGDHSCPCPHRDGECPKHSEAWNVKPYAPNHGPGEDPYRIMELATSEERRTSFRGVLNPS